MALFLIMGVVVSSAGLWRVGFFRRDWIVGPVRWAGRPALVLAGSALVGLCGWGLATSVALGLAKKVLGEGTGPVVGALVAGYLIGAAMLAALLRLLIPVTEKLPAGRGFEVANAGERSGAGATPAEPPTILASVTAAGLVGRGLLGLALALPFVYSVQELAGWLFERLRLKVETEHELLKMLKEDGTGGVMGLIALSAVVAAPLFEELLFRGVVQTALARVLTRRLGEAEGRWGAILMASAGFASLHPAFSWPGIFALSVALGCLYERTGKLTSCMVMHAGFNAISVAAAMWSVKSGAGAG